MSYFQRAAGSAVIAFCTFVAVGGFPIGSASGATLLPPSVESEALVEAQTVITPAVDLPGTSVRSGIETPSASLTTLVQRYAGATADGSELNCLATAVYFESKGEPLAGQLAVAKVVMNRTRSGRFAPTICGVVRQPSQFSFVRGGGFPAIHNSDQWRSAVGVAQVAMKGLYASPAPDALYFHAKRVAPKWGKRPVASVGHHLFYR